jgi:hypothetical protein
MLFLFIVFLFYALSIFVNPYGAEMPRAWFSIMSSDLIPRMIQEHASLVRTGTWQVLALGIFYVAALIGIHPERPRVTWLIPLVWLALTWSRTRNAPLFAVAAVIALSEFLPRVRWARWLSSKGSVVFRMGAPEPRAKRIALSHLAVPSALVAASMVLILMSVPVPLLGQGWVKLDNKHWPADLLQEIRKYEARNPEGSPILNDMKFGGFLMYHAPRLRVFIDDRCELYKDDFLREYAAADPAKIEKWAKEYNIRIALAEPGSAFDHHFRNDPGWKVMKAGKSATLYERVALEHS